MINITVLLCYVRITGEQVNMSNNVSYGNSVKIANDLKFAVVKEALLERNQSLHIARARYI